MVSRLQFSCSKSSLSLETEKGNALGPQIQTMSIAFEFFTTVAFSDQGRRIENQGRFKPSKLIITFVTFTIVLINKDKALNFGFNMLMALGSRLTVANEAANSLSDCSCNMSQNRPKLSAKDASAKTTLASHL
ncbi:hypothetical protein ACJIZ3_005209 [Penstemon smallii]|uniref:Uncharacterized protein n=1 Tax=Penstemon smallii TaxID=265156 RepID=A0ABD3S481_9LAMI